MTITFTATDPFDTETDVDVNKIVTFTLESDAADIDLAELNVQMDPIGAALVDVIVGGNFEPGWEGPQSSITQGPGPEEIIVEIEYESLPFSDLEGIAVVVQADEAGGGAPFSESFSFTTGAAAVINPKFDPQIPTAGDIDVDVNADITFDVDAQLGGATLDNVSLNIAVGGVDAIIAGVFQPGFNGIGSAVINGGTDVLGVTIDLTSPLAAATLIEISGDVDEAPSSGPYLLPPYDFTTAAAAAGVSFDNQDPAADEIGVAISTDISFDLVLTGGDNLDASTLIVSVGPPQAILNGVFQAGYAGTITGDGTPTLSVTINPDADLDAETGIPISTTVDDDVLSGPYNQNYSFTTAAAPDVDPPVLGNNSPDDGDTDVDANPFVWTFEVTDPGSGVDQATINARIRPTGGTFENAVVAGVVQTGWTETAIDVIADGFRYTVQRVARLNYESGYEYEIDAGDLAP